MIEVRIVIPAVINVKRVIKKQANVLYVLRIEFKPLFHNVLALMGSLMFLISLNVKNARNYVRRVSTKILSV